VEKQPVAAGFSQQMAEEGLPEVLAEGTARIKPFL
jgi:hypothetical protein